MKLSVRFFVDLDPGRNSGC